MHDNKTCNERVTLVTKMRVSMTGNCNRNSGAHVQGGWRLDSKCLSLPHYLAQSALLFARVSTSLWVHGSLQSCWSMSLSQYPLHGSLLYDNILLGLSSTKLTYHDLIVQLMSSVLGCLSIRACALLVGSKVASCQCTWQFY